MKLDLSQPDTDLATLSETPATLTLRHPITDDPMEDEDGAVTISLIGADSTTAEKKRRALANRNLKRRHLQGDDPAAQAEKEVCELLASLTRGWSNICDASGPIAFSLEAAAKLYKDRPWIRKQVDAFVSNPANFAGETATLGN